MTSARSAVLAAVRPKARPDPRKEKAGEIAKAIMASVTTPSILQSKIDPMVLAQQAIARIQPLGLGVVPADVYAALLDQGMDFNPLLGPGRPLDPIYGVNRQPRDYNYIPGQNIASEPGNYRRIPFGTLTNVVDNYDLAWTCKQHIIADMTSMRIKWRAMDGYEDDPKKEIAAAQEFLKRPDGIRPFRRWLAMWQRDVIDFDAGCLYRMRNKGGNVRGLAVIDGTTISPLINYFGDVPVDDDDLEGDKELAPAFLQFVQGIPWGWHSWDQLVYSPFTPIRQSVYGVSPIETVLLNANTDARFQWHFLQMFTEGMIPEGFMEAPPDQSSSDQIADWQEVWDDWVFGDQSKRYGMRWVPSGAKFTAYKPQTFDAAFPEHLMRRTVAAYNLTPQDLGILSDVNRATSDTQMDTQFRISTEPRTNYVEDIINGVLQDDLDLPVEFEFDTGLEKEDRLMEAQAWSIYIGSGMASPDEARERVLGLPIDPDNPWGRGIINTRLGWMPASYPISVGGDIDPETFLPRKGTVIPTQFVVPGSMAPDPTAKPADQAHAAQALVEADQPNKAQSLPKDHPAAPGNAPVPPALAQGAPNDGKPPAPNAPGAPGSPPPPGGGNQPPGQSNTDDGKQAPQQNAPAAKEATAGVNSGTGLVGFNIGWQDEDDDEEPNPAEVENEAQKAVLEAWYRAARTRVKRGRRPQPWADPNLSVEKSLEVWRSLRPCRTVEQVDSVFAKALEVPKAPRWPGHRFDIELAEHYAPVIGRMMRPDPAGIHAAIVAATHSVGVAKAVLLPKPAVDYRQATVDGQNCHECVYMHDDGTCELVEGIVLPTDTCDLFAYTAEKSTDSVDPAAAQAAAQANVTFDQTALMGVMREVLGDAYIAGTHAAAEAIGGTAKVVGWAEPLNAAIDWDAWQPGWGDAASKVAGPGLRALLDQAQVTIRGIADVTYTKLGNKLAAGIAAGDSTDKIARDMSSVLSDPARNQLIARTEVARAMTAAARDTYQANDIEKVTMLVADPCPECEDIKDSEPDGGWDLSDAPDIPIHPNCRCALSPETDSLVGTGDNDDNTDEGDDDE